MATVNSYKDKYIGADRPSIYDILQKVGTPEYKNNKITLSDGTQTHEYEAVDIGEVKIGGNTFRNYGQYQFVWEKTFVKSPERSEDGSIGNLNSYATFLTPHLIMDFSVMSIDDYREIMKMHYEANEYTVECYDTIYNRKLKAKMYFATEEMAKLYTIAQHRLLDDGRWEEWVDLVGVTEYKVELIGTNNDLDLVSVIYHLNPPPETGYGDQTNGEESVYKGEEIIIGTAANSFISETFGGVYKFKEWKDDTGMVYPNGYAKTINQDTVLYANWEPMSNHILTFNYGIADSVVKEDDANYKTQIDVVQGQSIGILPTAPLVPVKIKNGDVEETYNPYKNGAWYKTPIKAENSNAVSSNTPYWLNRDSSLYLLYEEKEFNISLYISTDFYKKITVKYNADVVLPYPEKEIVTGTPPYDTVIKTLVLDGWYKSNGEKFSGKMPPHDIDLFGQWILEG